MSSPSSPPAEIVTLADIKRHLRLGPVSSPLDDADVDLVGKLAAAHELVLTKVAERVGGDGALAWHVIVDGWDATTAPEVVKLAILLQAAEFYRYRGDDEPPPAHVTSACAPAVLRLLNLLRDPVLS